MKIIKSLFRTKAKNSARQLIPLMFITLGAPLLVHAQISCQKVFETVTAPRALPQLTLEQWDTLADQAYTALSKTFDDKSLPEESMGYFNFTDPGGLARPQGESLEPIGGDAFQQSFRQPVELTVGLSYRFGGGAVLFDNHVYPNDFFVRNQNRTKGLAKTKFWKQVVEGQPVLKWQKDQQKFILATNENASVDILQSLVKIQGAHITLYRGTTNLESSLNELILQLRNTAQVNFAPVHEGLKAQRDYLSSQKRVVVKTRHLDEMENAVAEVESVLKTNPSAHAQRAEILAAHLKRMWKTGDFGAAFTTDSHEKASVFAKGAVVEYILPSQLLLELVRSEQAYAGAEGQIEIAFITDKALDLLLNSFHGSEQKTPDANIWSH